MQRYTVYFIWKLLYMFWVVTPPIIRSASNCIYSIWYLSHRYCYLPLSWKSWNWFGCAVGGVHHPQLFECAVGDIHHPRLFECAVGAVHHPQHTQISSNSSTIAADSSNGVTNTRCCRYSCLCS